MIPFKLAIVLGLAAPLGLAAAATKDPTIAEFHSVITPILETHCYECHGDGFDKGKIAFDTLDTDAKILKPELWLKVLNNTRAGLMPAERKPRLSADEQQKLERWIKYGVFSIDPLNPDPGRVTVRRLNRVEYRNTIRDLLGVDYNTEHEFPPDDTGFGFDNIGDALTTSPMLMEKYVAAAQTIIAQAVPTVPRKPLEQILKGTAFKGTNARAKDGKVRLSYYEPATVSTSIKTPAAGTHRVVLALDVRGNFVFDPGRSRVIFRIDGQEVLNQEFVYHDEKSFSFESRHKWNAGEHRLSIELQPLTPPDKKVNSIDLVINTVTIEGPLEKSQWAKTENYERHFPRPIPRDSKQRREYANELLTAFAEKAYRRPLQDDDGNDTGARLTAMAEAYYRAPGKSFEQGVAHAMAAVLSSPRFLFKLEAPAAHPLNARAAEVDEYSLASRLSYFLWSTMPDQELLNLAARNELRRNLAPQVKRMLVDARAEAFARNFTGQWLQARDVEGIALNRREVVLRDAGAEGTLRELRQARRNDDNVTADKLAQYIDKLVDDAPDVDDDLRKSMRRETEMFFGHLVAENRPVIELIDSNYTFVNEKLAALYGLPGVTGPEMRKVMLPAGSARGGVLTQGSALLVTSNPDRTSPVKRGLFVLANFLGTPPPPPPANVPALEASEGDFKGGHEPVLRDILKVHRENPACSSCHSRMDPIGLAFENFNAFGMWRDSERKQPIAASGNLITGESFNSVAELKRILAGDHRQEFYDTLTRKLLTYASGRGTEYYDVETIDQIVKQLNANDGRFSALLMGVIESAPFQKMRTQATATVAN